MESLGRFVVRRRRATLGLFALGAVLAAVVGAGVFARLQAAGFDDPGSQSSRAAQVLRDRFGVTDPVAVLVVESRAGGAAADPATAAAAAALERRLAGQPGVQQVLSYWSAGRDGALLSRDGKAGEMVVYAGARAGDTQRADLAAAVRTTAGAAEGLRVAVGGRDVVNAAITDRIRVDLARAEAVAVPLTGALLVVVFGGLVASGLPLVVGLGAIVGAFAALFVVTLATDVSVFALNLVTGLGLGLGIDYALLVVNRYREELARPGADVGGAVVRTVATAGRTVLVSGLTVALTLGALTLFPQYFLRSFGYAGVATTLLAVLSAVVALPAVLALLGRRVDALAVRRSALVPSDEGAWASVARRVMRRPWPVIVVVVAVLALVAAPARSVVFGQVDARALPASDPAAVASAQLADRFSGNASTPVDVVVPGGAADPGRLARYAAELSRVPGVTSVLTPASVVRDGVASARAGAAGWTSGGDARLSLASTVGARGTQALEFVDAVRAVPSGFDGVLVGGVAASFADGQRAIGATLPAVALWITLATLLLLFLFTGSVVLPVKAVILNVLSLGATLGLVVWVFQEGHLRWLTGDFTVTGTVDTGMAVLIGVTAFALSMDYEVFLLARIAEEHRAGRPTVEAVALGLQRSGRIISAAAVLLAVVFAAFVSSGTTNIKQLGLGVAFAILLDATVVRGLLVPALMRVMGAANWWAPAPLRLAHRRLRLTEA